MLQKLKHAELISAYNAFEAYAILKAVPDIELVLLDFDMPYVTGKTFHDFLRQETNFKELPLIFSSADEIDTNSMTATEAILKPYKPEELLGLIEKMT